MIARQVCTHFPFVATKLAKSRVGVICCMFSNGNGGSDDTRCAKDIVQDVKFALERSMLMPTSDVISIASILATNGYHKTALDCFGLANPFDVCTPTNVRLLISNCILKHFDPIDAPTAAADPATANADGKGHFFQHVEIALDILMMLKLKHGEIPPHSLAAPT